MSMDIDTVEALRASQLPEAFLCPGSARAPDVRIGHDDDASEMGTAVHTAMREVVRGWDGDAADLIAGFQGNAKELRVLVAYGRKAWQAMAAEIKSDIEPMTELPLSADYMGVRLTGHIDLYRQVGRVAFIDDWKSGRLDRNYYHQLAAYAFLALLDDANLDEVVASVIWLREQERETYRFTRAKIAEWASLLIETVVKWDGTYKPGRACGFCPRSHSCPAVVAVVRRDVEMFAATPVLDLTTMPGPALVELHRRVKTVARFAESFDEAFRDEVKGRGGSVDAGDGTVVGFVEENGKREIDTLKAWPLLSEGYTPEEMAEFVTISASALDEVAAKKAGRGKGAGAKRDLRAKLDALQAIRQPKVWKLKERRKEQS
jgi:hypothetical protein